MDCPIVSCRYGKVKGAVVQLKCKGAKPVYSYRNIPFGKPPVGNLRFMPPQPAESWIGIKDGTVIGKSPMQSLKVNDIDNANFPMKRSLGEDMDEDCLHLSVYTPAPNSTNKLPVMVYIHGGGYRYGSEKIYDGSALAGINDVVVVFINYRLNVFGFLSLGPSSICPGNAGLMDQKLALEWIRDNIDSFGGDKDNITIFGNSAGAISVNFHINSSASTGLFHKAISQSGQAVTPAVFAEDGYKAAKALLDYLGITETNEKQILEILQSIPAHDLIAAQEDEKMNEGRFVPTLDGTFLTKTGEKSLAEHDFKKIPYIIGCNNSEGHGLLPAAYFSIPNFKEGITEEEMKKLFSTQLPANAIDVLKSLYVKDESDATRFSKMYGDILGDTIFVVPAKKTADAHVEAGADVFMYEGVFRLRFSHDDNFGPGLAKKAEWCICDHTEEIYMFLGVPFTPGELYGGGKFSDEELDLSRKCMTYITNFAKHGDPNIGVEVETKWPKFNIAGEHLILDHSMEIGENFRSDAIEIWVNKVPELMNKCLKV